jgi:hypothetical protein
MQRNIFISYIEAYFSSLYKCFSSGLRSAAVIVIASAGHDNAHDHKQYNFLFLVRHVLIGVDHGKLDFVHGPVQGIEW